MGAALKRPDLFYAYVGIGQVINTRDNERISFDYGLQQAKAQGNTAAVKELESHRALSRRPTDHARAHHHRAQMGAVLWRPDRVSRGFDATSTVRRCLSPEYNAADVCAIDQGNVFTLGRVLPEFVNVDYKGVRSFPIPVVMFMGRHDYTTPAQPTADWLAKRERPRQARCVVRALLAYDSVGRARQDADQPRAVRAAAGRAGRQPTLTIRMSFARFALCLVAALHACAAVAFDFDDVAERAQLQARQPYRARAASRPRSCRRSLRSVPGHSLSPRPRAVARGEAAVRADVLSSRQVPDRAGAHQRESRRRACVTFAIDSADFDYGKNKLSPQSWGDLGFAGFRAHYPLNGSAYKDELVVFLGASYFRALGAGQRYGLSARGLAIDTVGGQGEEFPRFTEFWIVKPAADANDADGLRAAGFAARERRLSVRRFAPATRR